MMQIRDELANIRWRSYNGFSCPIVIRVAIGGYLNGGAVYHSQCGEVAFTHIPGLACRISVECAGCCGLLRTAIRCDDPVSSWNTRRLYRELTTGLPIQVRTTWCLWKGSDRAAQVDR